MTYQEIVEAVRKETKAYDASEYQGHLAIQVDIKGEGEGAFYIELKDGNVYVEPYEYYDRDCKFIVSGDDFIGMCRGEVDAVNAYLTGAMQVEGSIEKALEFSVLIEAAKKKMAEAAGKKEAEKKSKAKSASENN